MFKSVFMKIVLFIEQFVHKLFKSKINVDVTLFKIRKKYLFKIFSILMQFEESI